MRSPAAKPDKIWVLLSWVNPTVTGLKTGFPSPTTTCTPNCPASVAMATVGTMRASVTVLPTKVAAYGLRFKIEVTFRTLVHLLGGFAYRFWLKAMTTASTWPTNLILADYPEALQTQILAKVEAFERFVNLNAIALGLLQVLALELPKPIWAHFPRWFRTLPKHGYPSERIVQLSLQHQVERNLGKSPPTLLLPKFLTAKLDSLQPPDIPSLAA